MSKRKYNPGYEHQAPGGTLIYLENIPNKNGYAKWQCYCGNTWEARITAIIANEIKSCGCWKQLICNKLKNSNLTYLKVTYDGIKQRCYNPNNPSFNNYGERGIRLANEWEQDRKKFIKDVIIILGHRPSNKHQLDRINVDGDYTIENLRWVTAKENNLNKRNNRLITINNKTKPASVWAQEAGINYNNILWRIKAGWPENRWLELTKIKTKKTFVNSEFKSIYSGIKQRCYNPKCHAYKYYGIRGITMYQEWIDDYQKFKQYIINSVGLKPSQKHQLDRIDVNGNYEPGNLRWSTPKENCRNKRNNCFVEINGEIKTIAEWSEISDVNYDTIRDRMQLGFKGTDLLAPNLQIRFNEEEIQNIKELNSQGLSMRTLAKQFDCGHTTILDILHERGAYKIIK